MTILDDLYSVLPAPRTVEAEPPSKGDKIPQFPADLQQKRAVIVFLRHCGCPFSEVAFKELRQAAQSSQGVECYAVSHASHDDTDTWIDAVGGRGDVHIIVDANREIYGRWGLGITGILHTFGLSSLREVVRLAWNQGVYNRTTKGTRWQQSGTFLVNGGRIVYAHLASDASDVPNIATLIKENL